MPIFSVFCHVSCNLVSGHMYPLSPALVISALVCLDFAFHLLSSVISLSRFCTHPNHLDLFSLRNPAIGYMCGSFQMSVFLTRSSVVFPLAHRSMHISVLCAFSSPPSFKSIRESDVVSSDVVSAYESFPCVGQEDTGSYRNQRLHPRPLR